LNIFPSSLLIGATASSSGGHADPTAANKKESKTIVKKCIAMRKPDKRTQGDEEGLKFSFDNW
jgi:hypothetical protein